jgi:hypothetical protein
MQTDLVYVLQKFDSNSRKKITNPLPKIPDNLKTPNLSPLKNNVFMKTNSSNKSSKTVNESII